jgi:hypothetical protein
MTPGFDTGFSLVHDSGLGMNLTYKGLWYANGVYMHGAGVSFCYWPITIHSPSIDDDTDLAGWVTWGLASVLWLMIAGVGSMITP